MMNDKQEQRNLALLLVKDLSDKAMDRENEVEFGKDLASIKAVEDAHSFAMGHLLTFIDKLIDSQHHSYSPEIQELVDEQDRRLAELAERELKTRKRGGWTNARKN